MFLPSRGLVYISVVLPMFWRSSSLQVILIAESIQTWTRPTILGIAADIAVVFFLEKFSV